MTPDQREKLQLMRDRQWHKLPPPFDAPSFIAEMLLELAEPPMVPADLDLTDLSSHRPAVLHRAGPYDRPSDRRPNDGLGPPPLPLRKQLANAIHDVLEPHQKLDQRWVNIGLIVDAVLDVLDCDPGKLEEPTGDEDRRFGVRRYRQVIQAIRRGE